MRDLLPPIAAGLLKVESYGQEGFTIGGRLYTHSLLLFPDRTILWPHKKISDWRLEDFAAVTTMTPAIEVLLLGTGSTHQFVTPVIKKSLKSHGLASDSMDTGAACRTYNILLSEGRRVAALLLLD